MESEFPSNSSQTRKRGEVKAPAKNVERVVQGEVIRRKKPLGRRFLDHFVGGDARGVWGFVTADVLIPATKDAIADAFTQGIERMLFPDSNPRGRRGHRPGGSNYVNYNRYSRDRRDDPRDRDRPAQMSRRGRATHNFDEIILPTRVEAEEVVDRMFDLVSQYEMVTVADLYDLVGLPNNYTDEKWGWTDIRGAGVTRTSVGYLLDLPRPEALD